MNAVTNSADEILTASGKPQDRIGGTEDMHMQSSGGKDKAERFLADDGEFRLGDLITERQHPVTKRLSEVAAVDLDEAVRLLLQVDRDIVVRAREVVSGSEFIALGDAMKKTLSQGGKIVFSGCGATGRLSILLESMWRKSAPAEWVDRVFSIMTGGDFALVKSVESFEDYQSFGREQVRAMGIGGGDLLIAISEGGETSSVIGTALAAAEMGAEVFFVCNNPLDLLSQRYSRCRQVIQNPKVTSVSLCTGPMAVAGSTRMQATSIELLIVGAALEEALAHVCGIPSLKAEAVIDGFSALLDRLSDVGQSRVLSAISKLEVDAYRKGGVVTYYAENLLLDVFTDTTERSPTFSLPPFRRRRDANSPRPWAFVKSLLHDGDEVWRSILGREPRCLGWDAQRYRAMGASAPLCAAPPEIGLDALLDFPIGKEDDPSRASSSADFAVLLAEPDEIDVLAASFAKASRGYPTAIQMMLGGGAVAGNHRYVLDVPLDKTKLGILRHLAIKVSMNIISTAAMAAYGRVDGNVMLHVSVTNKKLIDRGIRIISMTTGASYEDACMSLFAAMEEPIKESGDGGLRSPVAHVVECRRASGKKAVCSLL